MTVSQESRPLVSNQPPSALLAVNFFLFLLFVLLIHNPISIYGGSPLDFEFNIAQIAGVLGTLTFLGAVLLLAFYLVLPRRFRISFLSVVFAAAMSCWIYSFILMPKVGVLDGNSLNLDVSALSAIVRMTVFCGILFGSFWLARKSLKSASIFVLVLNVALMVSSAKVVLTDEKQPISLQKEHADSPDVYRFSNAPENLLLVLTDGFQSDVFWEMMEEYPELARRFEGFIYFKNALAVGQTTYMNLPAMYSGEIYPESSPPLTQYVRDSAEKSFLGAAITDGVDVAMANPQMIPCVQGASCISSALVLASPVLQLMREAVFLLDLSAFRSVPLPLKPLVYNEGEWILQGKTGDDAAISYSVRDNRFLRHYASRMFADGNDRTLRFLYVINTHKPTDLNDDCEYDLQEFSRDSYKVLIGCALRSLVEVLDKLEEIGARDNTAIIIVADHGVPGGLPNTFVEPGTDRPAWWNSLEGAANPVFLVKPIGARGPISVSEAPVQNSDVGATVCDILGVPNTIGGRVVTEVGENEPRERTFFSYSWDHSYWNLDSIPGMRRHTVLGPVYDPDSWNEEKAATSE